MDGTNEARVCIMLTVMALASLTTYFLLAQAPHTLMVYLMRYVPKTIFAFLIVKHEYAQYVTAFVCGLIVYSILCSGSPWLIFHPRGKIIC